MTNDENNWSPPDPEAWKAPGNPLDGDLSDIFNRPGQRALNYILDATGQPVPERDVLKWARWWGKNRSVARTNVGGGFVSTIFLGIDYNHSATGPPILWETMIFGHNLRGMDFGQRRCAGSREQALAMHREVVRSARQWIKFPRPRSRRESRKYVRHQRRRMAQWHKMFEFQRRVNNYEM